jgi:type IV pilus assembly protein PilW
VKSCAGASLVELMIAGLLAAVTLAAAGQLFQAGTRAWRENDRQARLRDELRYALARLGDDLEQAGFFGEALDPARIALDASIPAQAACGGASESPDWVFGASGVSIFTRGGARAADAHGVFSCIAPAEFHEGPGGAGTDVLAIRRVGSRVDPSARIAGRVYLQTDGLRHFLYRYGSASPSPGGASLYEYAPSLWYLRPWSVDPAEIPRVPALCRKLLGTQLRMQGDPGGCIAQGIEDLQLELGLDRDRDGVADVYAAPTAPAAALLASIVAVRITLLARSIEPDPSYVDTATYELGSRRIGPLRDHYHRTTGTRLSLLRNPASMRAPREISQ